MVLYNLYIFVWIQHGYLANTGFALDPRNSVKKRFEVYYNYRVEALQIGTDLLM